MEDAMKKNMNLFEEIAFSNAEPQQIMEK